MTVEKKKFMISLPVELVDQLDDYCRKTGMNRSGYIGAMILERFDELGLGLFSNKNNEEKPDEDQ